VIRPATGSDIISRFQTVAQPAGIEKRLEKGDFSGPSRTVNDQRFAGNSGGCQIDGSFNESCHGYSISFHHATFSGETSVSLAATCIFDIEIHPYPDQVQRSGSLR
jgi:hypothetical protein